MACTHRPGGPEHGRDSLPAQLLVPLHRIPGCIHTGKVEKGTLNEAIVTTTLKCQSKFFYDIDLCEYTAVLFSISSAMQDRATLLWAGIKSAVVVCTMTNKAPGTAAAFDRDRGARSAYGEEISSTPPSN